jgi:uncharacterized integral membrane protein
VKLPASLTKDRPEQSVYVMLGVLALVVLYIIGFIVRNAESRATVSFVLFSARTSVIWVMLICFVLGLVAGILLTRMGPLARARRQPRSTSTPPPPDAAPR